MNILIAIVAFIVTIGVLVTFHEFGHFWVARRLGVRVLRFSVGFGRALWTRRSKKDNVEYVIAALPLGGYVKMLDEREGQVPEAELPHAFNRQPLATRVAVVLAGPTFNLIFAVLAYWIIFMLGIPGVKPIIGQVAAHTPAATAGFRVRDRILAVNGAQTPTWEAAALKLLGGVMSGGAIRVKVHDPHGGRRRLRLEVNNPKALLQPGALLDGLGLKQWQPALPAVLGKLSANGTAKAAGLRVGDRIVKAAGRRITDWHKLVKIIRARPGQTIPIVVKQHNKRFKLQLPIASHKSADGRLGHIGAGVKFPDTLKKKLQAKQQYNPLSAVSHALARTGSMSFLTLETFWDMVRGRVSWHSLGGPITIARYAGSTASVGLVPFLAFLALISINLGIINLFPIPMLDGGHLLYYGAEFVKGSPLSEHAQILGQKIGVTVLMTFFCFIIYNDIARIFS